MNSKLVCAKIEQVERKPQQQTLSIRVSDALREFLERSKHVISAGRGESVSTSDVAKILLESAKDDRLDVRLEVSDLGRKPTESLVAIRKKWEVGHPRTRAEWIFMAQYIQVACEELTEDPFAPGPEPMAVMLEVLLAVRGLRTDRGSGLDRYYLGNLIDAGKWNERTLDSEVVPQLVGKLIREIRVSGNGKKAVGVGRNFYVAIRDEEFQEVAALNSVLEPFMPILFRMAARGHWIQEHRPVRLPRDGSLPLGAVPPTKQGDVWISVSPGTTDVNLLIGFQSRDLMYTVSTYSQIREFAAMLKAVTFGKAWQGEHFHVFANEASSEAAAYYQLQRHNDGVALSFTELQWAELQKIYASVMANPHMEAIFKELSWIYGEL